MTDGIQAGSEEAAIRGASRHAANAMRDEGIILGRGLCAKLFVDLTEVIKGHNGEGLQIL